MIFHRDSVILHDLETVPESIEKLSTQLNRETDGATRAELERTLTKPQTSACGLGGSCSDYAPG